MKPAEIDIIYVPQGDKRAALRLSQDLGVEMCEADGCPAVSHPTVVFAPDGVSLACGDLFVQGDFLRMAKRIKHGVVQRELLVKAARVKGAHESLKVFDATAGLGEDSLLLAAAGFEVTLCEKNPVIAALLRDALQRGQTCAELAEPLARMTFIEGDSVNMLARNSGAFDVVYLDPMFPARQKSASVKKKLQLFQMIEQPCADESELFNAALNVAARRVVVKRPAKGPYLANTKPSYSIEGKAVRYDCYVC